MTIIIFYLQTLRSKFFKNILIILRFWLMTALKTVRFICLVLTIKLGIFYLHLTCYICALRQKKKEKSCLHAAALVPMLTMQSQ